MHWKKCRRALLSGICATVLLTAASPGATDDKTQEESLKQSVILALKKSSLTKYDQFNDRLEAEHEEKRLRIRPNEIGLTVALNKLNQDDLLFHLSDYETQLYAGAISSFMQREGPDAARVFVPAIDNTLNWAEHKKDRFKEKHLTAKFGERGALKTGLDVQIGSRPIGGDLRYDLSRWGLADSRLGLEAFTNFGSTEARLNFDFGLGNRFEDKGRKARYGRYPLSFSVAYEDQWYCTLTYGIGKHGVSTINPFNPFLDN